YVVEPGSIPLWVFTQQRGAVTAMELLLPQPGRQLPGGGEADLVARHVAQLPGEGGGDRVRVPLRDPPLTHRQPVADQRLEVAGPHPADRVVPPAVPGYGQRPEHL